MILISAGHHKEAQGATYNSYTEWLEAEKWRDLIVFELGEHRAYAVPSGLLKDKVKYINDRQPDIALEIHFNSAKNSAGEHIGKGCETLYYPGSVKGKVIAWFVQQALRKTFLPDRGMKGGWYRMDVPNQIDYHGDVNGDEVIDYFLRKTTCPAIIIEPEFIHRILTIQFHREKACKDLAKALLEAQNALTS